MIWMAAETLSSLMDDGSFLYWSITERLSRTSASSEGVGVSMCFPYLMCSAVRHWLCRMFLLNHRKAQWRKNFSPHRKQHEMAWSTTCQPKHRAQPSPAPDASSLGTMFPLGRIVEALKREATLAPCIINGQDSTHQRTHMAGRQLDLYQNSDIRPCSQPN